MDYLTSSLFVRDKQQHQLTRASSTRSAITPATTTTTTMESPSGEVPRQSILGFLNRGNRPRGGGGTNTTNSNNPVLESSSTPAVSMLSPPSNGNSNGNNNNPQSASTANTTNTYNASSNPRRRTVQTGTAGTQTGTNPLGYMLRRRRSANNVNEGDRNRRETSSNPRETSSSSRHRDRDAQSQLQQSVTQANGPAHRIRLVPHLDNVRSLNFEAICRDVRQGDPPLRIGRFTEQPSASSNKLAFKSKVVSRGHAEIWFENGTFYIKDTKSSSGTFLNHIRLSSPNTESRPFAIKDGDVLQLGVDYQGGTEEIYRCVKMRVEVGREWQNGVNAFNSNALAQLKSLTLPTAPPLPRKKSKKKSKATSAEGDPSESQKLSVPDCCICLSTVTVCQALFIAPCSHVYHYKCIRPLLLMHHPGFSCPICRTFANLEADVEEVGGVEEDDDDSDEPGEESVNEDGGQAGGAATVAAVTMAARDVPNADLPEAQGMDVEADPGAGVVTRETGDGPDDEELEYVSVEEGVLVSRANANPSSNSAVPANNHSLASTNAGNNVTVNFASRGSGASGVNSSTPASTSNPGRTPNAMNVNAPLPPVPSNTLPLPPPPPPLPFSGSTSLPNNAHVVFRSRSLGELHANMSDDQTEAEGNSPRQRPLPTHMQTAYPFLPMFAGISMDSALVAEPEGEMEGATFLGGVDYGARVRAGEGEIGVRMEESADGEADENEGTVGVRGKRKRAEGCL